MSDTTLSSIFFVAPAERNASLTTSALGLAKALQAKGLSVAYYKPIVLEEDVTTAARQAGMTPPDALSRVQVETWLREDELSTLQETIIAEVDALRAGHQAIVIEGISFDEQGRIPSTLNGLLAQSLGADLIWVTQADKVGTAADQLILASHTIRAGQVHVAGAIVDGQVDTLEVDMLLRKRVPMLGAVGTSHGVDAVANVLKVDALLARHESPREQPLTPPMFRQQLLEKARAANKRIVLPEGDEPRTLHAAVQCQTRGLARCVLVGDRARIEQVAADEGLTLPAGIEIIDPATSREQYVAPMVELRKAKGLTPEQASEQLQDSVVLGTMMLAQHDVDGLVSGAVHTTADTVRPALQLIKTAKGASIVSSIFFMMLPDQVMVFGDCAINPDPTAAQLADIAIQSAESALAFGLTPRVAMISYSTGSSGTGADVEKVTEATRIAQEKRPDLMVDGPLQYDAATVASVGRQKAPNSQVAGRANVLVFPDLNTGNTTYKAVQRSANVVAVGPMLQGLRMPVNDLSRGALVEDIVYTIALTALQAAAQDA